jgi:hypothetical protein
MNYKKKSKNAIKKKELEIQFQEELYISKKKEEENFVTKNNNFYKNGRLGFYLLNCIKYLFNKDVYFKEARFITDDIINLIWSYVTNTNGYVIDVIIDKPRKLSYKCSQCNLDNFRYSVLCDVCNAVTGYYDRKGELPLVCINKEDKTYYQIEKNCLFKVGLTLHDSKTCRFGFNPNEFIHDVKKCFFCKKKKHYQKKCPYKYFLESAEGCPECIRNYCYNLQYVGIKYNIVNQLEKDNSFLCVTETPYDIFREKKCSQ